MTMANKKKKTATTNAGAKSKEQLVIHQIVVKAPSGKCMTWGIGGRLSPLQTMDEQSSCMTCSMIS